jgi:ABC-type multidrug transport system fused ATPase/permease subunit
MTEGRQGRWSALAELIRPHRVRLIGFGLVSAISGLLEATFLVLATSGAVALASGAETVSPVSSTELEMSTVLALSVTAVVGRLLLAILGISMSTGITAAIVTDLRGRLGRGFLHATWEVQQSEPAGQLQHLLVTHTHTVTHTVTAVATSVTAAVSLIALMAAAIVVNAVASSLILVTLAVIGLVLRPLRKSIHRVSDEATGRELKFAHDVSDLSKVGLEIQTFGVRREVVKHVSNLIDTNRRVLQRVDLLKQMNAPLYISLAYMAIVVALVAVAALDPDDLDSLGAVMLVMLRSMHYGHQLQITSSVVAEVAPVVSTIGEAVERFEFSAASDVDTEAVDRFDILELDGIQFSYDGLIWAIRDVDLTIRRGEVIGIVGPSGGGKTTLVQLMLGVREPTSGEVRVNGHPMTSLDRTTWTNLSALVPQTAHIISGSLADNVRFFREFDDETVASAIEAAGLTADLENLPKGSDTMVGSRGIQLSGGQAQRLAIARALVSDPSFIVLDEPTASLDSKSELRVRETLARLGEDATVIIVAHRMSTLEECDRIMVVEHGRVTAFGSRDDVLEQDNFFRSTLHPR